mgnify:CR=1 FL=1
MSVRALTITVTVVVMIATVLVLMAAHTGEVLVWALAYLITGAVPPGGGLVYFAFVALDVLAG